MRLPPQKEPPRQEPPLSPEEQLRQDIHHKEQVFLKAVTKNGLWGLWKQWKDAEEEYRVYCNRHKNLPLHDYIIHVMKNTGYPLRPSELKNKAASDGWRKSSATQAIQQLKKDGKIQVVHEAGRKRDMRLRLT